jgi:hypothetical protein
MTMKPVPVAAPRGVFPACLMQAQITAGAVTRRMPRHILIPYAVR